MIKSALQGIVGAAITPFTSDYEIDVSRLLDHCERLRAQGCSHISLFGTTGEGTSLSTSQKVTALQNLKAAGLEMGLQIPAIMTSNIDDAANMLFQCAQLGCRAALILPPFYYPNMGAQGIADFIQAMLTRAKSPEIDLILYNIPQISGTRFTHEMVEQLVEQFGPQIVGIKDSTGDLESGLAFAKRFNQLAIFTGDDRVLPHLSKQGGAGMIGGLPNLFASDLCEMMSSQDQEKTISLQKRAAARIEAVDKLGGLSALRVLLAHKYEDKNWLRMAPPLPQITAMLQSQILDAFEQLV